MSKGELQNYRIGFVVGSIWMWLTAVLVGLAWAGAGGLALLLVWVLVRTWDARKTQAGKSP